MSFCPFLKMALQWNFSSFCRTEKKKKNSCRIFHKEARWRKDFLKRSGELPSVRDDSELGDSEQIGTLLDPQRA